MPCLKRPFDSPDQAKRQLRIWQRKGRRPALDSGHVYQCEECHGKFHIGRKHQEIAPTSEVARTTGAFDDLDDIFEAQRQRVVLKIRGIGSARRHYQDVNDDLEALDFGGDDYDVTIRR